MVDVLRVRIVAVAVFPFSGTGQIDVTEEVSEGRLGLELRRGTHQEEQHRPREGAHDAVAGQGGDDGGEPDDHGLDIAFVDIGDALRRPLGLVAHHLVQERIGLLNTEANDSCQAFEFGVVVGPKDGGESVGQAVAEGAINDGAPEEILAAVAIVDEVVADAEASGQLPDAGGFEAQLGEGAETAGQNIAVVWHARTGGGVRDGPSWSAPRAGRPPRRRRRGDCGVAPASGHVAPQGQYRRNATKTKAGIPVRSPPRMGGKSGSERSILTPRVQVGRSISDRCQKPAANAPEERVAHEPSRC